MPYYPRVSDVTNLEALEGALPFLATSLSDILDEVFLLEYQVDNQSGMGGTSIYAVLGLNRKLEFNIHGLDFTLSVNRHIDVTAQEDIGTDIPLTLYYEIPILRYYRNFNPSLFDYTPQSLFRMAVQVLGLSEQMLLERVLDAGIASTAVVTELNTYYSGLNSKLHH
jgi:hypothetical protein